MRSRPRGRFRRFLDRSALRSGVWHSIERCMHTLREAAPDDRRAMARQLSAIAQHFFDFASTPLVAASERERRWLAELGDVAMQVLAPATVPGTYETCCQRVRNALAAWAVVAHDEHAMSQDLPVALADDVVSALHAAYEQPPRAYHNFDHVREVLGHAERVPQWRDRSSVLLAILFHDAIYEAGQPDNEARSAELATRLLSDTEHAHRIPRVQRLIRLTARHGSIEPGEVDHDEALFLDCDMAVLGAPPAQYDGYEKAIAEEYRKVPPELYRKGRAAFLRKLLARPAIYLSPFFRGERETPARANIERALEALD